MTLAQLSEASGIPVSSLSKLELGQLHLTCEKLLRLKRALGPEFCEIVENDSVAETPRGRRSVIPSGQGAHAKWGPHKALVSASELLNKLFTPIVLEVTEQTLCEHGPLKQLKAEAYVMALEGALALHLESYAPLRLEQGDAVYFDGRTPHALISASENKAKALLVVSPTETEFT